MHKHRIEKVLVVDDELRAARPDHRQGHPEGARQPQRRQGRRRAPAGRRRGRRRRRHRGAGRGAGRRRRGRDRGRHRARPFAGRARPRALGQEELPERAGDRRQHRHRRRRAGADGSAARTRSRSASARVRSAPRASSPASACRRSPRSSMVAEVLQGPHPADRRWRHPLFRRHRQGAGRRRQSTVMIGGLFAGTEEAPGEVELFQGRSLQELPRHGLARRDGAGRPRTAISRTPPTPTSWCPRASKAACRIAARCATSSTSSPAACAPRWATSAARTIEEMRTRAEVRARDQRRHAREPRARRADHQGTAELPRECGMTRHGGSMIPRPSFASSRRSIELRLPYSPASPAHDRHPRRQDPHPRLRRAVHAADRAAHPRVRRVLRDLGLGPRPGRDRRVRRRRASSCPAARNRPPRPARRARRRKCSTPACRSSASATACRPWPCSSAAPSKAATSASSAMPRSKSPRHDALLDGLKDHAGAPPRWTSG